MPVSPANPLRGEGSCGGGGAPRDSAGSGATEEGLTSTSLSLFTFMHWRRKWQPTPVFLPGESQERRGLVGCRLWGRTDTTKDPHDATKILSAATIDLRSPGGGHGNPLQCSCLENPRNGGVWWAAVYGVAQSEEEEEGFKTVVADSSCVWFQSHCRIVFLGIFTCLSSLSRS